MTKHKQWITLFGKWAVVLAVFLLTVSAARANSQDDLAAGWSNMRVGRCADAFKLFATSAKAGNATAAYRASMLGLSLQPTEAKTKDYAGNILWAAQRGNLDAEVFVGRAYIGGQYFTKDVVTGMAWLAIAGEHGSVIGGDLYRAYLPQLAAANGTESETFGAQIDKSAHAIEAAAPLPNMRYSSDGNDAIWPKSCSASVAGPARILSGPEIKALVSGHAFTFTFSGNEATTTQSETISFLAGGAVEVKQQGLFGWAQDKTGRKKGWKITANTVCYDDVSDKICWRLVRIGDEIDWLRDPDGHLRRPDADKGASIP